MSFNKLFIISILLVIFSSCDEKITLIEPTKPINTNYIDSSLYDGLLLWKHNFFEEGSNENGGKSNPIRIVNDVLITNKEYNALSTTESSKTLIGVNKNNGELIWENDFLGGNCVIANTELTSNAFDNQFFESCHYNLYAFNAITGELNWHHNFYDHYLPRENFDYYYFTPMTNNIITFAFRTVLQGYTAILSINLETGISIEIYRLNHDDNYRNSFLPPITYINNENDTLIYVVDRKTSWGNVYLPDAVDIHCYNITKDSLLWKVETEALNSSVYKPQINIEANSFIVNLSSGVTSDGTIYVQYQNIDGDGVVKESSARGWPTPTNNNPAGDILLENTNHFEMKFAETTIEKLNKLIDPDPTFPVFGPVFKVNKR